MTNNAKPNGFETDISKATQAFEEMLTPPEEQEAIEENTDVEEVSDESPESNNVNEEVNSSESSNVEMTTDKCNIELSDEEYKIKVLFKKHPPKLYTLIYYAYRDGIINIKLNELNNQLNELNNQLDKLNKEINKANEERINLTRAQYNIPTR